MFLSKMNSYRGRVKGEKVDVSCIILVFFFFLKRSRNFVITSWYQATIKCLFRMMIRFFLSLLQKENRFIIDSIVTRKKIIKKHFFIAKVSVSN